MTSRGLGKTFDEAQFIGFVLLSSVAPASDVCLMQIRTCRLWCRNFKVPNQF
jgi:hypothetical protein